MFPASQCHSHPFRRLSREVKIWKDLSHPNIVEFVGYAIEDQGSGVKVALVSKWCEKGDIVKYLREGTGANRIYLVEWSGHSVFLVAVTLMSN